VSALALDGTRPRSRRRDPITSVDAGRSVDLCASQQDVLAVFYVAARPLALHELVREARKAGVRRSDSRIRSACAELVDRKLVVLVEGDWAKTRTGRRAHRWQLAADLGVELMPWQRDYLERAHPAIGEPEVAPVPEPAPIVGDPSLGGDGLRVAVDADCPYCGWPERWFDTLTRRFGCVRCTYTSDERNA